MAKKSKLTELDGKYNSLVPVLSFRISAAKKDFLRKYYPDNLQELLREQADILIVRALKMENK
jgi:hypothetical protein